MMMFPLLLLAVFLPAAAYGAAIGYSTVGCFGDRSDRAIATLEGHDANLDGNYQARVDAINKCAQAANSRGFTVFAVQNGGWCASSATAEDTYDKYGPSSACNADGEGGPWANEVYFIKDTEPPTCSYCPADIIIQDATTTPTRVNWNEPTCSDNSGLSVTIVSNRANDDLFDVPGSYEVLYQVTDAAGNTYDGCSFHITLKKKTCPLYAAPLNGALTCNKIGDDLTCVVMCKTEYDFVFNPPMLYFCSSGKWNFFSILPYDATLPWPDCSGNASPSGLRTYFPKLYFVGDANDANVQDRLRENFISVVAGPFAPSAFCKTRPLECNKDTVLVYPGQVEIDTEPPACGYCPADIIIQDATTSPMRVNWNEPTCSDNSGLSVTIVSNRANGDLFDVPGSYEVLYQVTDAAGNTYDGCSFQITLKKKTCPLYAPPQNGALTCNKIGDDLTCMAMCKTGYDFVFNPPMLYYCSSGKWNFFSIAPYDATLPWPDCSGNVDPPSGLSTYFPELYFVGDANDPNVQDKLRENFISLMNGPFVPSAFCRDKPSDCNVNTVQIYLG